MRGPRPYPDEPPRLRRVLVPKCFKFSERMELEGIFEPFNLTHSRNQRSLPRPLTFNFDGTASAGFGEPRQARLGVRFEF